MFTLTDLSNRFCRHNELTTMQMQSWNLNWTWSHICKFNMDRIELYEHVSYDITEMLRFLTWATFEWQFQAAPHSVPSQWPPPLYILLTLHWMLAPPLTAPLSTPLTCSGYWCILQMLSQGLILRLQTVNRRLTGSHLSSASAKLHQSHSCAPLTTS